MTAALLMGPGTTRSADPGPTEVDPNRVAVLPLENLSPDETDAYIADGLTVELISRLSRLRGLRVIPLSAVMHYRGADRSPGRIGRELGVGTIIEGSSRRVGDTVRLTLFLIEVGTERLIWSKRYDADVGGLLDVQQRIADEIAVELKVSARTRPGQRRTSPVAADEYLRGRALLGQLDGSLVMTHSLRRDLLREASDHFRAALDHDSTFADAWSGLAATQLGLVRSGLVGGPGSWEAPRAAAELALALNQQLPEAHVTLAIVQSIGDRDRSRAERHLDRAIELDPSYADAYSGYALHLRGQGRLEEALRMVRRAQDLAPRAERYMVQEGQLLYLMGRHDEVIDLMERYLADPPPVVPEGLLDKPGGPAPARPFWAYFTLALAQFAKGNHEAALEALEAGDPTRSVADTYGLLGYLYARTGRTEEARAVLAAMDDAPRVGPPSDFHRAVIHVGLGENERALDLLESATRERSRLLQLLKVEPMLEPLRGHPRFQALLRRMGMADSTTAGAAALGARD